MQNEIGGANNSYIATDGTVDMSSKVSSTGLRVPMEVTRVVNKCQVPSNAYTYELSGLYPLKS